MLEHEPVPWPDSAVPNGPLTIVGSVSFHPRNSVQCQTQEWFCPKLRIMLHTSLLGDRMTEPVDREKWEVVLERGPVTLESLS